MSLIKVFLQFSYTSMKKKSERFIIVGIIVNKNICKDMQNPGSYLSCILISIFQVALLFKNQRLVA